MYDTVPEMEMDGGDHGETSSEFGFHAQHPLSAVDFTIPIVIRSILPVQVHPIVLYSFDVVSPLSSMGPQSHQK